MINLTIRLVALTVEQVSVSLGFEPLTYELMSSLAQGSPLTCHLSCVTLKSECKLVYVT